MQYIDYQGLSQITNPTARLESVEKAFVAAEYISVSDAVLLTQTGNPIGPEILKMLDAEAKRGMVDPETGDDNPSLRRQFKLRCLCDEWGDSCKEGDIIRWKHNILTRDKTKRKYTMPRKKDLKRQGLESEYKIYHSRKVDREGCITVEFEDASRLIGQHGLHYKTGLPISRLKEHGSLRDCPKGGKRHTFNWRFVEVVPGAAPMVERPNRGTIVAMQAARAGEVEKFDTPAALMTDLHSDAPVATPAPAKQKRKYTRKAKPAPTGEPTTKPDGEPAN